MPNARENHTADVHADASPDRHFGAVTNSNVFG
jgi:hypothetical protein